MQTLDRRVASRSTQHLQKPGNSYVILSPCRDEASLVRRTLDSVVGQTVPPTLWVIIDDGSSDETPQILSEYAAAHSFIRVLTRTDRGHRDVGPGVIDAFCAGLETIDLDDFDFLCKLDLDVDLPENYFALLLERMSEDRRLGSCSGKAYYEGANGKLIREVISNDYSTGQTKFYRTACFRQIGGFVREVMWDGIDCHRSRMLGWKVCSFDEPGLRFLHLRPMGSSQQSIVHGRIRHGRGQYFMGTSASFIFASAVFRVFKPPYVIGGAAILAGFMFAMIQRQRRYSDLGFRRYLRRYQWKCLLHGKRQAQRTFEERGELAWNPDRGARKAGPAMLPDATGRTKSAS